MDEESVLLLSRFRDGDTAAADEIFHRYVERLTGLARNRIGDRLGQRVDAEDVVQSVYRSFFCRAGAGQFSTERSGDLWRLLATITVNKVRCQARHHRRQKRSIDQEQPPGDDDAMAHLAAGPADADAAAVVEELEALMADLPDRKRTMLELRLQGQSVDEIAAAVGRSQRTVLRFLDEAHQTMQQRLLDSEN